MVGQEFHSDAMLAVTDLSRTCRRAYFQALAEGKVLRLQGPAGTGKTETIKDTSRMLGCEPVVVNCSGDPGAVVKAIKAGTSRDNCAPLILDEANRTQVEDWPAILEQAKA